MVKRYDWDYNASLNCEVELIALEHEEGTYVTHTDYAKLEATHDAMSKRLVATLAKLDKCKGKVDTLQEALKKIISRVEYLLYKEANSIKASDGSYNHQIPEIVLKLARTALHWRE